MKRFVLPVIVVVAAAFATSQVEAADTAAATAKLSHYVVTVGDPATARVNLHARFSSVDSVCFDFVFANDRLDPGEILVVTPLQLYSSLSGFGAENAGSTPQAERILCVDSSGFPDVTALFADGRDRNLEIGTQGGSVEIASLTVTVTGTRA